MKNQISALRDQLPNLDNLFKNWFGVGRSWLKYLLITLLMLLATLLMGFPDAASGEESTP